MFRSFRFGSVFGVPLRIDITFLLVLPLFAWVIGVQIEPLTDLINGFLATSIDPDPLTLGYRPWLIGLSAALGLFLGVLLHEIGHALVAIRFGYGIGSITLWIFGGLAQLTDQPEAWRHELAIAITGPIVSVVIGIVAYLVLLAVPASLPALSFLFGYLALMNVGLAIFNMLPAFPMDGGRVLRALLSRNRPFAQATQLAAEVGKLFALLMGLFGLFEFNIVLIGIAFFIYIAAASEAQQTVMRAAFEGVTVDDIMTREVHTVGPRLPVADLLERMFNERHTGYPVVDGGRIVGVVTLSDAKGVEPVEREAFIVEDVMTMDVVTVTPETDAMGALMTMQRDGIGRLPVVDDRGDLVGIVSRTDLMTALNVIQETGSSEAARTVGDGPTRPGTHTDGGPRTARAGRPAGENDDEGPDRDHRDR